MYQNYNDISYAESPFGTLNQYMTKTFGWMFAGLLVTFAVAIGAISTGLVYAFINSGVFFIIENISADHSNVITLSGGMKVKKYFYGNPGQFELLCDVMQYIDDHHYEVTGNIILHNIVENYYIAGKNDLSMLEVPVRKLP